MRGLGRKYKYGCKNTAYININRGGNCENEHTRTRQK